MPGKSILSELYLGSDPIDVEVREDQLVIILANNGEVAIPLQFIGALPQNNEPLSTDSQILILHRPPKIDHVHISDSMLSVYLVDGRTLSCPLAWFPRLLHADARDRNYYELVGDNDIIHWPTLDEDIELSRLIVGGKSMESEYSLKNWLQSRQPALLMAAD